MDELIGRAQPSASWLQPRVRSQGAIRYVQTIRDRWWLVLLATVVAVLAALVYLAGAPRVYQAEADLLITPVSNGDATTAGLGLITESTDPTQDISTSARLASTPAVAQAAKVSLRSTRSAEAILGDITAEPIAQSNLVAIQATAGTADGAARLANAFARAVVQVRTTQLRQEIAALLPRLQGQLAQLPASQRSGPGSLGERISGLQALASGSDPTVRLAAPATPPASPSSPRPKLAVAAGIVAGVIVGIGAAFALQALDPRLRREEQLRELFRLPLLARIPDVHRVPEPVGRLRRPATRSRVSAARRGLARTVARLPFAHAGRPGPLTPDQLTPTAVEAYRTLRATLAATIGGERRSFLITSSSPGEGKTTTAINLAYSLAHAGNQVILIEGDMRRPTMANALGVRPMMGVGAVLIKRAELEQALITTRQYGENLRFLLAEPTATALADRLSLPTAAELVADAEAIADCVVIDSPPLTEVIDALPLAQQVGGVLVMTRMRTSRLNRLADLGEILAQGGVTPVGLAMVGVERHTDSLGYASLEPVARP